MAAGIVGFVYHSNVEAELMSQSGGVGNFIASKTREVEAETKRNLSNVMVNVRTGRLRSSVTSTVTSDRKGPLGVVAARTDYAKVVHDRKPYLTAALEKVSRTIR